MKKLVILVVLALCIAAVVTAQTPRDGFYFAQDAAYAANGMKNQVVLQVQGGRITSANWNIVSYQAGAADLKAVAASAGGSAATWAGNAKKAEDALVSSQNANATSVSGVPANFSVEPFFALVRRALAAAPIARGSYTKDGWYYAATDAADTYHTRNTALITVVNGTIVDALWNGILQMQGITNPSKMITSIAGGYPMPAPQGLWHIQAARAAQALVTAGDPSKIAVKANQTTDAVSGCTIMVKDFLDSATRALQAAR
jgi:major membrane immunogen (membrane-anchored lipoprotein)